MSIKQKIIGIVGCGFIGGALKKWIENFNPSVLIKISDPPKGYNDDLTNCDAIFISIHIPTEIDGSQDLTLLESIIEKLPNKPIFIRTTLLPKTCDTLAKKYNKEIYFMPEFLTERTAYEDFCKQPMIFCGREELLKEIFKCKHYVCMSNIEAEIAKYAHNVFGALKVTYFNGIYEFCKGNNANYEKVRLGFLQSGYINEPHTMVPGPDGNLGYGGKCFPKDVNAFKQAIKSISLSKLIETVATLNTEYRNKKNL